MYDQIDAEMGWGDYYDQSGSVNTVIDPSGIVYAGSESNLIDGAKMTCYKLNDKTNQWEVWNAEDYGQVNPQYTQSGGKYAWDVPEGHYYVTCEMEGYEKIFSEGFTVSPPKFDLNFNLISIDNPVVSNTSLTDNTIELEFSTYVKTETVSKESVHLEGTENPYDITAVKENEDDVIAKKFIINGDFTDAATLTIIIDDTITGYNDLPLKKYTEELNNQGIISIPTVEELAYTGSELTGVPECEGYTVTGGTATAVGSYKAVLTLNEGYKWAGGSTEKKEVNWSIKKAEISGISVIQKSPLVYNGKSLKAEVVASGKTVDESPITFVYSANKDGNYGNSIPEFVKPGEYTVYYKASAENHNVQTGEFKIVIDGADISNISVSQKNTLKYTGKPLTAIVEATGKTIDGSKITFEYSTEKDGEYTDIVPALTDSGEYTVYYRATAENHAEKIGEFTVTIEKADITDISISQTNVLVYTGDPLTAAIEATGKTVDDSEIKFAYSTEKDGEYTDTIPDFSNVGEYTVYYRVASENHDIITDEFTVTVFVRGDISKNGEIDIYDAIEIAKHILGVRKFNNEEAEIADYNNDSKIDLYDTIAISKYLLN